MIDHYLNVGGQGLSFVYKKKNSILCILFEYLDLWQLSLDRAWEMPKLINLASLTLKPDSDK